MGETAEEKDEGRSRIVLKIDGSFVMAVVALLGTLGFGVYNTTENASEDDMTLVSSGVVETADACTELQEKTAKLASLVKIKDQEINELYATTDWMVSALKQFGRSHPNQWRRLRRDAPAHVNVGDDSPPTRLFSRVEGGAGAESDDLKEDEGVYDQLAEQKLNTPKIDLLRESIKRKEK